MAQSHSRRLDPYAGYDDAFVIFVQGRGGGFVTGIRRGVMNFEEKEKAWGKKNTDARHRNKEVAETFFT